MRVPPTLPTPGVPLRNLLLMMRKRFTAMVYETYQIGTSNAGLPQHSCLQESPRKLVRQPVASEVHGLEWSPRVCFSGKFPGAATAAGSRLCVCMTTHVPVHDVQVDEIAKLVSHAVGLSTEPLHVVPIRWKGTQNQPNVSARGHRTNELPDPIFHTFGRKRLF